MPIRVKKYLSVFILLVCCRESFAFPTRPFSAGVGFGVPELAFVEAQVAAFVRCQVGASFTYAPPSLMPKDIPLEKQTITLSTGDVYEFTPAVTPSFYAISPFIRLFTSPNNNFYLQLMWALFKLTATITGDMTPRDNPILPVVPVTGAVTITQSLPTFSVGYFFSSPIYYFNLNIGIASMISPTTSTAVTALVPDALGGNTGNEVQLDGINSDIQTSVTNASTTARASYGLFPSIHLSFGFYF